MQNDAVPVPVSIVLQRAARAAGTRAWPVRWGLVAALALAGCATVPDLDRIDMRGAGATPDLVPLEGLLDATPATGNGTATATDAADQVTDRATALRRRAAALQDRAGVDPATRARMDAGVPPIPE